MEEDKASDYAHAVHQSLLERPQLFGIGEKFFYGIIMVTVLLCALISFWCLGIGLVALLVCKKLCKKESLFLEFLAQNMQQHDTYAG